MLTITQDVKGKHYEALIDVLFKHCTHFAFVEDRRRMEIEDERLVYMEVLTEEIRWDLIERTIVSEWETTRLSGDTAYLYSFHMNYRTVQFLKERSQSLFSWIHPELPEDLMFYAGDTCVLAVCSHESFFVVDEEMWERIRLDE
ncbi:MULTISPECIES: stage III sporulation protein AH [unclassified Exiguobacterium]|uniref:stage III sporulation protein AH n=1 Tax=unclassified Exiguobacterium TaxID=2644629 RepID=UPI0020371346|nr:MULTISPECIES: stage III sporulation protein AH [unclassified Exiguobacterium]